MNTTTTRRVRRPRQTKVSRRDYEFIMGHLAASYRPQPLPPAFAAKTGITQERFDAINLSHYLEAASRRFRVID